MPVAPNQEMGTDQEGKRCPAPDSGSEELVPAAPNQDVRTRPGEAKASNSPGLGASASHTPASAASQPRPWTRKDTDLSKALSRVLRHRSNLDEAGYAKLADVLFHPLIRDLNPTMDWIVYIVKANAKQRFSLNEAGTHIRAVQGHSVPVDSSKLLRQLESGEHRQYGAHLRASFNLLLLCSFYNAAWTLTRRHPRHLLPQTCSPCHEPSSSGRTS